MDPITLLFVGLQIGVSLYNQSLNSELTARIKEEQRKAKLDEIKNNQRRDMERFQRLCQLQEEMEVTAHVHRIEKIQQDFLNTFEKMAHKENLDSHYHLNVSPYVIQRSIIPLTASDLKNTRQELFCILTASNDKAFNKNVLPYLDESICDVISKFWNESSNHTLCYYQNLWDSESNLFSNEDVENIKSLINTPTVAISPWFQKEGDGHRLILKISAWGMGNQESLSCEIDTGVSFDSLSSKYSSQEISDIVNRILPNAICSVGQIADVYYWVTNYLPPQLPYLIGNGYIKVSKELSDEYAQVYSMFYKHLVLGSSKAMTDLDSTLVEIAEINQYNYPERSLSCLKNILTLTDKSVSSTEMIEDSIISYYLAKTDKTVTLVNQIDASLLQYHDLNYVSTLIEYAKFKDYLYILFNLVDQDADDDYNNFLNFSLAGQIEYILKEANIELFYLPSYEHEDTKKSETAFNAVLKNNEKAYSTLEHDVRMGQYLFDLDDKPKSFFISRDHSFDLYRKKCAELFCRSMPYFWQLFTPVNFVNSVDLIEMKFEPQALSEDLLFLIDHDGGKENAKYFADVNTKLTNLPGITAAERRNRQKLNFELFTNKDYNDIEEENITHADVIADKLNRTWDSLYNHLREKCPDNIEKAFAPLLNNAIYMSVVTNLKDYVDSFDNDLNALFNKVDNIIYRNLKK